MFVPGRGNACFSAVLIAMLTVVSPERAAHSQGAPPPAVIVKAVVNRPVTDTGTYIGRVVPIERVEVVARVPGFIEQRNFTEGQIVKKGELLFRIEQDTYKASVDQQAANLAKAKANEVNANLQLERNQALVKSQAVPQATIDQLAAAEQGAKADILQAQALLEQAQINLGYTEIRSPIDGKIGIAKFTVGNLVQPSSGPIATIVSQDPIYAVFPVSQRQLQEIRESRQQEDGRQIKIEIVVKLTTGKEYAHPGVWNFTDIQVNQQTDTLIMRATLPNPERLLVDGEFVTVVVRERKDQPRLVVPQAALQLDQAGTYVLIVNSDRKVESRRITVGPTQEANVVVESGLKEGEQVIIDGIQKVRVGQEVAVTVLPPGKGA
jgi:membrane fusion protein (multidrug efflux system)